MPTTKSSQVTGSDFVRFTLHENTNCMKITYKTRTDRRKKLDDVFNILLKTDLSIFERITMN